MSWRRGQAYVLPPSFVNSRLRKPDSAAWPGNAHGGRLLWLCTRPLQIGRSGSPAMNVTSTSWPMRGTCMPPSWLPAHGLLTRTQQVLCWSFWPRRSHGNCTLMRPRSSVHRFSLAGQTTLAICAPWLYGLGCVRAGRSTSLTGCAVKSTSMVQSCLR